MKTMTKTLAQIGLLLAPAAILYLAGYAELAHYVALGSALAAMLTLLARPMARFALLIPLVYALAAITAQSTDGVAALIVALVAGVGAASSLGYHRGLLAVLAAALIGSFEPAAVPDLLVRTGGLAAGSTFGALLGWALMGSVEMDNRAVSPQTALSYAVLSAVLVLVAWLTARAAGFMQGWWLPLVVAAAGEPYLDRSRSHSMARLGAALVGALALVLLADFIDEPLARAALLLILLSALVRFGSNHVGVQALLLAPVTVLLARHGGVGDAGVQHLQSTLLAGIVVFTCTLLGKWLFWKFQPDRGRVTA
jgi:hypothetical protein